MAAGDQSPETFASLYLGKKKSGTRKPPQPSLQADLFSVVEVSSAEPPPAPEPMIPQLVEAPPALFSSRSTLDDPRRLWSVRELVTEIRQLIEQSHLSIWVEGEISNCRPAPSGHVYFTLKDGDAQLPVVLFRRQAQLLSVKLKDGDAVEIRGRISVYESRGQLQLIAETVELRGAGALELAFKRLKAKLQAEGLFAEERKRPLPPFPQCVGIITSLKGAVIRDIVNVVQRRHARLNLLVYPAAMQGEACASSVEAGVRWFNENRSLVDIIVIARGGGSMEDLAGFNNESLARTISTSELPVVSAVGHETDFTIADFVADLRAPTPSAAAELVTSAQHKVEERVALLEQRVHRAGRYQVMLARQRYSRLAVESVLLRLHDAVSRRDQRMDELRLRMETAMQRRLREGAQRLGALSERLRRQDPTQRLVSMQRRLQHAAQSLERLRIAFFTTRHRRLESLTARLEALSPLAVLNRGYALVYREDGTLLREAATAHTGETVRARLAHGSLTATVKDPTA